MLEERCWGAEMATAKRIPKRSIIGSRVAVQCLDRLWRCGVVAAMRSTADCLLSSEKKFSVRLEGLGTVLECREADIVGPGFLSVLPANTRLREGQPVFVTNGGREVEGRVAQHDHIQDLVDVDAKDIGKISKKLEDIRLMESRKSARLLNTDTDFSRLADFNIVEQRKLLKEVPSRRRLHSMSDFHDRKRQKSELEKKEKRRQRSERGKSSTIDVPTLTSQSRKRRTSESRAEVDSGYASSYGSGFFRSGDDTNVKECTAAMVLMNLSASPRDKWLEDCRDLLTESSPNTSSPTTPRPSPANSFSYLPVDEDEEPSKRTKRSSVIFECTWRGCFQREKCQERIERHVRQHLGLPEPGPDCDRDFEEEFYYTEIEHSDDNSNSGSSGIGSASPEQYKGRADQSQSINIVQKQQEYVSVLPHFSKLGSSAPSEMQEAQLSTGAEMQEPVASTSSALGDHIGMVRPSYEAPTTIYVVNSPNSLNSKPGTTFFNVPYSLQGKKLVSIVPKPDGEESSQAQLSLLKSVAGGLKNDKKCRKVYGIEQKDMWCTQCKWKKACGRFAQS